MEDHSVQLAISAILDIKGCFSRRHIAKGKVSFDDSHFTELDDRGTKQNPKCDQRALRCECGLIGLCLSRVALEVQGDDNAD